MTVTFAPTAAGAQKGTLAITSNDPKKPLVKVNLTGAGQAGKLARMSASSDDDGSSPHPERRGGDTYAISFTRDPAPSPPMETEFR